MKLTTNNFQFIKMKWFFSLFLGIIISLFAVLPVKAIDMTMCAPKGNLCHTYSNDLSPSTTKCLENNGCFINSGSLQSVEYNFCSSIAESIKEDSCYNINSRIKCNENTRCEIITISVKEATGQADPVNTQGNANPVNTQGNADPVGYSEELNNPLGIKSVNSLIGKVINSLMGIVGALALLMFVYGGLTWMTSSGSQDKVKKGKDIMLWAAVGLVIIFSAYGLTKFIINITIK